MVGILITGHGNFPSGALSAVNLVAGNPGNVSAVDFVEGMSAEELKVKMEAVMNGIEASEILVLADLAGGTPFRTAVELKMVMTDKNIRVIAGANMPALMEAALSADIMDLAELAPDVAQTAAEGIVDWDAQDDVSEEPEFEDGL